MIDLDSRRGHQLIVEVPVRRNHIVASGVARATGGREVVPDRLSQQAPAQVGAVVNRRLALDDW